MPHPVYSIPPPRPRGLSGSLVAIADRYDRHRSLGHGGMALVYEATDRTTQRQVALKQLRKLDDPTKDQRNLELFEREFHTLTQLEHPRIVQVYDFGVDPEGAYYTMELLSGGDLQERAPMPWREACSVARDVCSALSLLHSRRFVHRDVSPRNVRRLPSGPAKLIDFGAMSRMGPTKLLVGTPPCCAPESVALQSVDGRTDLFGLGATLYYALVGWHAFPARSFSALPDQWNVPFPRPSEIVPEIPSELDALVLDLLRTDPDARPASAAEVMERLTAIDGEGANEELRVANAYLVTPVLVGRDAPLSRVRRRLQRHTDGRSRSMIVEGNSGAGRTRFLDACSLEATLAGQIVVRADADDADSGEYGVVRAVARQLIDKLPVLARETAAPVFDSLVGLIPALATADLGSDRPVPDRVQIQRALHHWLTTLSKRRPLVLVIDDFDRIDEPSASFLALLEQAADHDLCLLMSVDGRAVWTAEAARKLFAAVSTLRLEPLSAEDTEKLLHSVFGEVPHVEPLSARLHELCGGSPRQLLQLTQHLVDRGIVRYSGGTWTLPSKIDAADLPASLADALQARVKSLPEPVRHLAAALALAPDTSFKFEELGPVSDIADPLQRLAAVETLIAGEMAKRVRNEDVKLSQHTWIAPVRATLTRAQELELERRLAACFEQRPSEQFRAAQHWFRADEPERALDVFVHHAAQSNELTSSRPELFMRYILGLPDGWFATFLDAARKCEELGRPALHRYELLARLAGIMGPLAEYDRTLLLDAFVYLRQWSGYDDYERLDPSLDPGQRLKLSLGAAQARYAAASERERGLDVKTALRDLARAVVAAVGAMSYAVDLPALRALPKLAIYGGVSPALEVCGWLVEGLDARCSGRMPQAREIYLRILERVSQPDRATLSESHERYVRYGVGNAIGLIEAGRGMPSCLEWAEKLETFPAYEVNATMIRMIYALCQGNLDGAEQYKRTADRLRIQNSAVQLYEGGHLIVELNAHALSGDLTRVRHARDEIVPFAKRFDPWVPVLRYANVEYYRLTRDYERARAELEKILDSVQAGTHQIWAYAAAAHVNVLLSLGENERALEHAEAYTAAAQRELDHVPDLLQLAAALAAATMQRPEAAQAADAVITRLHAERIGGLYLGFAHETRARIALRLKDMSGFGRHAELCGHLFLAHKNAGLTAKYHRLLQEGRRKIEGAADRASGTPESFSTDSHTGIEIALGGCQDSNQRARLALTLLTRRSGAAAGALFLLSEEGPSCVASVGDCADPSSFLSHVNSCLEYALSADDVTITGTDMHEERDQRWVDAAGHTWTAVALSHNAGRQLAVTGVVVLAIATDKPLAYIAQTVAAISRFYAERGASSMLAGDD